MHSGRDKMNSESVPQNQSSLAALDARLAQAPFGNADRIIEGLHVRYQRRLDRIAANLPVAGELLHAIRQADSDRQYRALGDTVVRCAVHYALTFFETGAQLGLPIEQCADVFRATLRHLDNDPCEFLGSGLVGAWDRIPGTGGSGVRNTPTTRSLGRSGLWCAAFTQAHSVR